LSRYLQHHADEVVGRRLFPFGVDVLNDGKPFGIGHFFPIVKGHFFAELKFETNRPEPGHLFVFLGRPRHFTLAFDFIQNCRPPGNTPIFGDAAKVVKAHPVEKPRVVADAPPPPLKTIGFHAVPVVEGRGPVLSQPVKVIRRRAAVRIQVKLFLFGPDVHAVAADINGHVAHEIHVFAMRISQGVFPLAMGKVLRIRMKIHDGRIRFAVGPGIPGRAPAIFFFERGETHIVLEPGLFLLAEAGERFHSLFVGLKFFPGGRQDAVFERINLFVSQSWSGAQRFDGSGFCSQRVCRFGDFIQGDDGEIQTKRAVGGIRKRSRRADG